MYRYNTKQRIWKGNRFYLISLHQNYRIAMSSLIYKVKHQEIMLKLDYCLMNIVSN